MLGAPHVKTVRGVSDFGYSYVYVIFEDGTDLYWARSRTLEYLSSVARKLPHGVTPSSGRMRPALDGCFSTRWSTIPASTASRRTALVAGLVPALSPEGRTGRGRCRAPSAATAGSIRSTSTPTVCGPMASRSSRVVDAVRGGNDETGGRLLDFGGTEYMVRGRGYARSVQRLRTDRALGQRRRARRFVLRTSGESGIGPDLRRGVTDLDGAGEVVSGIVIMREGENALEVIEPRARLARADCARPAGRRPGRARLRSLGADSSRHQQRSGRRSSKWRRRAVRSSCVFLWHVPSAVIPIITMPAGRAHRVFHSAGAHGQHHVPCAASPSPSASWSMPRSW